MFAAAFLNLLFILRLFCVARFLLKAFFLHQHINKNTMNNMSFAGIFFYNFPDFSHHFRRDSSPTFHLTLSNHYGVRMGKTFYHILLLVFNKLRWPGWIIWMYSL